MKYKAEMIIETLAAKFTREAEKLVGVTLELAGRNTIIRHKDSGVNATFVYTPTMSYAVLAGGRDENGYPVRRRKVDMDSVVATFVKRVQKYGAGIDTVKNKDLYRMLNPNCARS